MNFQKYFIKLVSEQAFLGEEHDGPNTNKERMEAHDREMQTMRHEISKIPAMEERLTTISVQTEKTHQMLLMFMESITKERTTMSEKMAEPSVRETMSTITNKKEGPTNRGPEHETKNGKIEGEDGTKGQNKF